MTTSPHQRRRWRLRASLVIPSGALLDGIISRVDFLLPNCEATFNGCSDHGYQIVEVPVVMSALGRVEAKQPEYAAINLAETIEAARNICEQNVTVSLDPFAGQLVLRTNRLVVVGETLKAWYDPITSALAGISPLLPINFQANLSQYKCHKCLKTFDNPNPLKAHLLNCGNKSHSDEALLDDCLLIRAAVQGDKTSPSPDEPSKAIPSNLSTALVSATTTCEPLDLIPKSMYRLHTTGPDSTIGCTNSNETCGYLCIYCGKKYSRKYGLKIHLRTHTGYKPLTCKFCKRAFGDPSNLNKHLRLHLSKRTLS